MFIQQCSFQGSPNYSQIGIFGKKINHLATLLPTGNSFANILGSEKSSFRFIPVY
jgi:hypothetical protein